MDNKIIDLIEHAARQYNAIMPCHGDWHKSWTIERGRVVLWFNFPVGNSAGLSTGLIREDDNN